MKMLTTAVAILSSTLVLAPAARSATGNGVTLRYKFKAGEELHYVMEQKMKMQMDVAGHNVTMDITQTIDMTWQIVSVDTAGKAQLKQRIDRIRFSMDGPNGKEEYDSQGGKNDGKMTKALAPAFAAMSGAEFTESMDATGQVSDFTVPQKLTDALKGLGNGGMGSMLSPEQLKHMSGGVVLPPGPVTKGQTWNNKNEIKMPFGKMTVDSVYTFEGPARYKGTEVEKIAVKPKVTLEADANSQIPVSLKDVNGTGTVYFDRKAGRLLASELQQTMKMEMTVNGNQMTQNIDQQVSMKLQGK